MINGAGATDGTDDQIRVVIADDDALVRAGISGILGTADDIRVVGEADDGAAAATMVETHRCDVVLLDIQMPRMNGIRALAEIRRRRPELPVAMLTTFSDDHLIADAIGGGALGFLLKSDEPQQLIVGVRALARGGGAFSPRVARWLARREGALQREQSERERLERVLTPRQLELLVEVAQGRSNGEIARRLHLSEGTVKQYLSALFLELGIDNRVHAAIAAYRAGLVDQQS